MPTIDSLIWNSDNCALKRKEESERIWISSDRVAYRFKFDPGEIYWQFDLTQPAAAAAFYQRESHENKGVMLQMNVTKAAGVEALSGLFKYRSPSPLSRGMAYIGILWIPFRDCRFQINVEAVESGTSGFRESAVMLIEGDKWPTPPPEVMPIVKSQKDLDALYAEATVQELPSDNPKYDSAFPEHPLSLVRAGLSRIIHTVQLSPDARRLRPYRVRR